MKSTIIIIGLLIVFSSCSTSEPEAMLTSPESSSTTEGEISISAQQFESSDFELGKLQKRPFTSELEVNGSTHLPEKNKAAVSSFIGGSVGKLNLIHGEWVNQGQFLFTISNPELIGWQQDYLILKSEEDLQKSELQRQELMAKENISAKKALKQATVALKVIEAKLAGLSKKLDMVGINKLNVSVDNLVDKVAVYAPKSGYLTEIDVKQGQYLQAFETAMEISNTNHLHMELQVMEKDLPLLRKGQKVRYTLQEDPSEEFDATVYLIEKHVGDNRMITVHCHLEEEQEKELIPGMFVNAKIEVSARELWAVPEEAVVEFEGHEYILEHQIGSEYTFIQKDLHTNGLQNGYYAISNIQGIDTSATYLNKGAYFLISGGGAGHSH